MGDSSEIELVGRAWEALIRGGPEVLGEVLAPDAQWYGVEDGRLSARAAEQASSCQKPKNPPMMLSGCCFHSSRKLSTS
jgi:hypothetical protein